MSGTAIAQFERGLTAQQAGLADDAIVAYEAALAADPSLAAAHFNLGQLLRERRDLPNAARAFEAAVRLRPGAADAWLSLGLCREGLNDLDTALRCYQEAVRLDAGSGVARFNAGNVLRKQGDLLGAAVAFRAAGTTSPSAPEVWLNLGNTLRELGQLEEAGKSLARALELKPEWIEAEWNLALTNLAAGRLAEGWAGYEARWARAGLTSRPAVDCPRWRGEPVVNRRVLVWREQGLGDEVLFATCVPDLAALGATVTLVLDSRLVTLYQRALPDVRVVDAVGRDRDRFDYEIPLGSLPGLLRAVRTDFRGRWSYLTPTSDRLAAWAERFRPLPSGLKVGVCWRSGARQGERSRYYPDLADWRPILATPRATFINLQYDDCGSELAAVEATSGVTIRRWNDIDLKNDLEGVAALMWHLDVVITAPTAVGALAGALGTETWQLDPGTDWTAFGEERSPWFPSIRLFRRASGVREWSPVIEQVAVALRDRAEAARSIESN